jgi:hypothetical protein
VLSKRDKHIVMLQDFKTSRVNEELSEYIFTTDIIGHLSAIIQSLVYENEPTGNVFWVSGVFGSGKSHFMKYLYFMLNKNTSKLALENLNKANLDEDYPIAISELKLIEKKLNSLCFDFIMVDAPSHQGVDSINILNIILNEFNQFRGYNPNDIPLGILLEKHLDKKGVFEQFKVKVEEVPGFNWDTDAANVAVFQLEDILKITKDFMPEIDLLSLHDALTNPNAFEINIQVLKSELREFLDHKDDNYRLIFMIDNIMEFIYSSVNSKTQILQLHSIFMELGILDSRISFVVSSQISPTEDLSVEKLLAKVCDRIIYLPII